MFFGAGNTIFPLIVGIHSGQQFGWAFLGLLLTAISGPLLGLLGATLYRGRVSDFFSRAGKVPGRLLMGVCFALLGPFAVLPRCVTVAMAALKPMLPPISPIWLSLLFCMIALFCCYRKKVIIHTLGVVLSPLLICCLLLIIYQGCAAAGLPPTGNMETLKAFKFGLMTGYDTMDLIASIFFSAGIWNLIAERHPNQPKMIFRTTLIAGTLGCLLLALIYLGLSYAASVHSDQLLSSPIEALMSQLAMVTLGPYLGMVANTAVALACLTTVISLVLTLSEIFTGEIAPRLLNYHQCVIGMILLTFAMTLLGFHTIMVVIHSVVVICYPLIILLTLYNIGEKFIRSKVTR